MSGKSKTSGGLPAADEYALALAQERIVVEAQVAIHRLLRKAGLKQSDLAGLLGVSEARVSQLFGDNARNLTLRTLARVFHVLGSRCRVVDAAELTQAPAPAETAIEPGPAVDVAPAATTGTAPEAEKAIVRAAVAPALAADAWLLGERDIFELLSEDAPFASRAVWVSDHKVVPANENHPSDGAAGRRSGLDARRWAAAQDRYAFG